MLALLAVVAAAGFAAFLGGSAELSAEVRRAGLANAAAVVFGVRLLTGVLHECGHALATKAFGYALVAYLGVILNLNPLLQYDDGYFVLMDVLDRPNLRPRAPLARPGPSSGAPPHTARAGRLGGGELRPPGSPDLLVSRSPATG